MSPRINSSYELNDTTTVLLARVPLLLNNLRRCLKPNRAKIFGVFFGESVGPEYAIPLQSAHLKSITGSVHVFTTTNKSYMQ